MKLFVGSIVLSPVGLERESFRLKLLKIFDYLFGSFRQVELLEKEFELFGQLIAESSHFSSDIEVVEYDTSRSNISLIAVKLYVSIDRLALTCFDHHIERESSNWCIPVFVVFTSFDFVCFCDFFNVGLSVDINWIHFLYYII